MINCFNQSNNDGIIKITNSDENIINIYMNKEKVLIRKSFKFRLNTTPQIEHQFANIGGATRFVWNKAFKHAFDKNQPLKRIPKYKKKGEGDSFRYQQGFKIDQKNKQLYLPKIGWVKYRNKQKIIGTPKNITINRKGDHSNMVELDFNQESSIHIG